MIETRTEPLLFPRITAAIGFAQLYPGSLGKNHDFPGLGGEGPSPTTAVAALGMHFDIATTQVGGASYTQQEDPWLCTFRCACAHEAMVRAHSEGTVALMLAKPWWNSFVVKLRAPTTLHGTTTRLEWTAKTNGG